MRVFIKKKRENIFKYTDVGTKVCKENIFKLTRYLKEIQKFETNQFSSLAKEDLGPRAKHLVIKRAIR